MFDETPWKRLDQQAKCSQVKACAQKEQEQVNVKKEGEFSSNLKVWLRSNRYKRDLCWSFGEVIYYFCLPFQRSPHCSDFLYLYMGIAFFFYSPFKAEDSIIALGGNSLVCGIPPNINFDFFTQIILFNELLLHYSQLPIFTFPDVRRDYFQNIVSFRKYIIIKKTGLLNSVSYPEVKGYRLLKFTLKLT
jgi:hypothetical protein